jgi:DeoR/GlpR family transcriptional regulator of sugar metabolism
LEYREVFYNRRFFLLNDRQQKILDLLEKNGEVNFQKLKTIFSNVSIMTLRRDLIGFENDGILIRTHGGGKSIKKITLDNSGEENAYSRREAQNIEAKNMIAKKALLLLECGRSIYFDAGSTIMSLAKILPDKNFSIVTSSANISIELSKKEQISVVLLGGLLNKNTLSVSGPASINMIESINIDLAFMSVSGFSIENGFTVSNIFECELKKKVVVRAKKVIILMDSTKINKDLPFTFVHLDDINILITENALSDDINDALNKFNVQKI